MSDCVWKPIDQFEDDGCSICVVVAIEGYKDPFLAYPHDGYWWDLKGFQLIEPPTHFLFDVGVPPLPRKPL